MVKGLPTVGIDNEANGLKLTLLLVGALVGYGLHRYERVRLGLVSDEERVLLERVDGSSGGSSTGSNSGQREQVGRARSGFRDDVQRPVVEYGSGTDASVKRALIAHGGAGTANPSVR